MEAVFSNLLPRSESFIFVISLVQRNVSYWEAQASNALIQNINFFLCFFPLFFCQMPIEETHLWQWSCKTITVKSQDKILKKKKSKDKLFPLHKHGNESVIYLSIHIKTDRLKYKIKTLIINELSYHASNVRFHRLKSAPVSIST